MKEKKKNTMANTQMAIYGSVDIVRHTQENGKIGTPPLRPMPFERTKQTGKRKCAYLQQKLKIIIIKSKYHKNNNCKPTASDEKKLYFIFVFFLTAPLLVLILCADRLVCWTVWWCCSSSDVWSYNVKPCRHIWIRNQPIVADTKTISLAYEMAVAS